MKMVEWYHTKKLPRVLVTPWERDPLIRSGYGSAYQKIMLN